MDKLDLGKLSFMVKKFKQRDGELRDAITKGNWVGFKRNFCEQAELVQNIKEDIAKEAIIVLPQNKKLADDLKKIRADDVSFFYFYCLSIRAVSTGLAAVRNELTPEQIEVMEIILEKMAAFAGIPVEVMEIILEKTAALAGIPGEDDDTGESADISGDKLIDRARLFEEAESKAYELIGRNETYQIQIEFSDGSFEIEKTVLDPYPFLERYHEVSALILGSHPPEAARKHFETIRDLFILGRFEASVVFCRAIFDEAFRHYLRRKGFSKTKNNIIDLNELRLHRMIQKARLPDNIEDLAMKTKDYVDKLIHTKSGEFLHTSESEALEIIKGTMQVLEYLYK